MFSGPSSTITEGIRVNVRTAWLLDESALAHQHYVFAYHVEIINESGDTVKLLRRKWNITDALGRKRVIEGPGVIGKTPEIAPGESHEYVSRCDFSTPQGKMEGHYSMIRLHDGTRFKVKIPAFTMIVDYYLN